LIEIRRLIWAFALGTPWWAVLVTLASYLLPEGWGVQSWWGPCLLVALFAASVWGCYWGWGKHERQLVAREGKPVSLPNWTVKWIAAAMVIGIAFLVYHVMRTT
jgi:hypothetical protein